MVGAASTNRRANVNDYLVLLDEVGTYTTFYVSCALAPPP
jgi:hypothetical protein